MAAPETGTTAFAKTTGYSVGLLSVNTSQRQRMLRELSRLLPADLQAMTYMHKSGLNAYQLFLGVFDSPAEAAKVIKHLPTELKANQPFIIKQSEIAKNYKSSAVALNALVLGKLKPLTNYLVKCMNIYIEFPNSLLVLAAVALTMTACAPEPFKDSAGHLPPVAQVQKPGTIPKPVLGKPFLPPPARQKPEQRFTVVVHDVPVRELLFAIARDAKVNVDIAQDITGKASLKCHRANFGANPGTLEKTN